MFTGIIETMGVVTSLERQQANLIITVTSSISQELKVDQSVSHNGACLTVVKIENGTHTVVAVDETLKRTNLGSLTTGARVNLERAMPANGRFDGHFVQGHVDQKGKCDKIEDRQGSWKFWFSFSPDDSFLVVEKGSVCVNGVSLTVAEVKERGFSVAIIPYTFENTTFRHLRESDEVNIEFDILGKYVRKGLLMKKG